MIPERIPLPGVIVEVMAERIAQDEKWGIQRHDPIYWIGILGEEFGEACKGAIEDGIVPQALEHYRAELIQVAAVAVAAVESLDARS